MDISAAIQEGLRMEREKREREKKQRREKSEKRRVQQREEEENEREREEREMQKEREERESRRLQEREDEENEEAIRKQLQTENSVSKQISFRALTDLKFSKRKRPADESTVTETGSSRGPKSPKLRSANIRNLDIETASVPTRFAPARKGPRENSKAVVQSREVLDTRSPMKSLEWYQNVDMKEKFGRGDVQSVQYVSTLIENCVLSVRQGSEKVDLNMKNLRSRLHEIEFHGFLSGVIIKKSGILEDNGLPRIFDSALDSVEFPWDIKADAEALYMRWITGDFAADLMRGIKIANLKMSDGKVRKSYTVDPTWAHKKSASVFGHNNLINGQWWPLRICAVRDGGHGEQEAGIYGQVGKGAISVVVSDGGYADKDNGETIEYCGTESNSDRPTRSTKLMLESWRNRNLIRVFRAENSKSEYAPKEGIRYDGLYRITEPNLLVKETAMYRFTLTRQEGQDPIRYHGDQGRPSSKEVAERSRIRSLLAELSRD